MLQHCYTVTVHSARSGVVQDALERATKRDSEGAHADAIKLYHMVLSIVHEGLSLQVQSSGFGAGYSNVAKWRDDMTEWQEFVHNRSVFVGLSQLLICTANSTTFPLPVHNSWFDWRDDNY